MINENTVALVSSVLAFIYGMTRVILHYRLQNKKLNIQREKARRSKNVK